MAELMLQFQVPSIQYVNFAHRYVEGIASAWVESHIDLICWMHLNQFVDALRSEFGDDSDEKDLTSVYPDLSSNPVCEKLIESSPSNISTCPGIDKSSRQIQPVTNLEVSDTKLAKIHVSLATDDHRLLQSSEDNNAFVLVASDNLGLVMDFIVPNAPNAIRLGLNAFMPKIDVPIAWKIGGHTQFRDSKTKTSDNVRSSEGSVIFGVPLNINNETSIPNSKLVGSHVEYSVAANENTIQQKYRAVVACPISDIAVCGVARGPVVNLFSAANVTIVCWCPHPNEDAKVQSIKSRDVHFPWEPGSIIPEYPLRNLPNLEGFSSTPHDYRIMVHSDCWPAIGRLRLSRYHSNGLETIRKSKDVSQQCNSEWPVVWVTQWYSLWKLGPVLFSLQHGVTQERTELISKYGFEAQSSLTVIWEPSPFTSNVQRAHTSYRKPTVSDIVNSDSLQQVVDRSFRLYLGVHTLHVVALSKVRVSYELVFWESFRLTSLSASAKHSSYDDTICPLNIPWEPGPWLLHGQPDSNWYFDVYNGIDRNSNAIRFGITFILRLVTFILRRVHTELGWCKHLHIPEYVVKMSLSYVSASHRASYYSPEGKKNVSLRHTYVVHTVAVSCILHIYHLIAAVIKTWVFDSGRGCTMRFIVQITTISSLCQWVIAVAAFHVLHLRVEECTVHLICAIYNNSGLKMVESSCELAYVKRLLFIHFYCIASYDSRYGSDFQFICKKLSVINAVKVRVGMMSVESDFWNGCKMELLVHLSQFKSIHGAAKFLLQGSFMRLIGHISQSAELASGEASVVRILESIKQITSIGLVQFSNSEKCAYLVSSTVCFDPGGCRSPLGGGFMFIVLTVRNNFGYSVGDFYVKCDPSLLLLRLHLWVQLVIGKDLEDMPLGNCRITDNRSVTPAATKFRYSSNAQEGYINEEKLQSASGYILINVLVLRKHGALCPAVAKSQSVSSIFKVLTWRSIVKFLRTFHSLTWRDLLSFLLIGQLFFQYWYANTSISTVTNQVSKGSLSMDSWECFWHDMVQLLLPCKELYHYAMRRRHIVEGYSLQESIQVMRMFDYLDFLKKLLTRVSSSLCILLVLQLLQVYASTTRAGTPPLISCSMANHQHDQYQAPDLVE